MALRSFARRKTPAILFGASRILDLSGGLRRYPESRFNAPQLSDWEVVEQNWRVVGQDLFQAIVKVKGEYDRVFGPVELDDPPKAPKPIEKNASSKKLNMRRVKIPTHA